MRHAVTVALGRASCTSKTSSAKTPVLLGSNSSLAPSLAIFSMHTNEFFQDIEEKRKDTPCSSQNDEMLFDQQKISN